MSSNNEEHEIREEVVDIGGPNDETQLFECSDDSERWNKRFHSFRKSEPEMELLNRKQKKFYTKQNELIDQLTSPWGEEATSEEDDTKVKIAVYASLGVNVALFTMQIVAAIISHSLALIATSVDAFMDLLSGAILMYTERARRHVNTSLYPTGRTRMEPIGIILFSALMSTVSIFLMMEGITSLAEGGADLELSVISIVLVAAAIGSKVALFLYCRVLTFSPSAMTLAQDHRNDIVVNSFGITMALLGYYVRWWLDPMGALLVAVIILRSWATTAYEQMQLLVGKTAPAQFLQRVTYIAMNHHPEVLKVDTVRAFHVGNNFYVEVDIVLPRDMPLWQAHDIGESLQEKLEAHSEIERAFVHLDHDFAHKPEHKVITK